jgi:hypothetical protein
MPTRTNPGGDDQYRGTGRKLPGITADQKLLKQSPSKINQRLASSGSIRGSVQTNGSAVWIRT